MIHPLAAIRKVRLGLQTRTLSLSWAGLAAIAFIIARAPLKLCAVGLVGIITIIALVIHPVTGLFLLAFTIPFGSLYPIAIGSFTLDISDLVVALIMLCWYLRYTATRQDRLEGGWWLLALGMLLFTLLLGLLPTTALSEAIKELLKWLEFAVILVFVVNNVRIEMIDGIITALLMAGSIEAVYGIYQFITGSGPEAFAFLGSYTRAYGTFGQPNPFAGYLGLLLPVAYCIVLMRWPYAAASKNISAPRNAILWWIALAATCVMFAALLMSGSRGALAGLAAGIVMVILVAGKKIWPVLAMLLVVTLLLGPALLARLPEAYIARVTDTFTLPLASNLEAIEITDANFSLIERAAHWQAAWHMFEMHPWFGVGLGQYTAVYPLVAIPRWANPLGHAHNYLLNTLAEGGIVGLVTYLVFQVTLLVESVRTAINRQKQLCWLGLAASGTWSALFVHNLFDNLYVHYLHLILAILFGLVLLARKQHKSTLNQVKQ
ncbi:MAG: O-antigen ligase family protein [Chloroflexi bacterium]|nr:O-antigen ligase family protein [Chloroflexota bacterium]